MAIPKYTRRPLAGLMLVLALVTTGSAQSRPAAESRPEAEAAAGGSSDDFAPLFKFCPAQIESVFLIASATLPDSMREFKYSANEFFQKGVTPRCVRSLHAGRKFGENGDFEGASVFELEKPVGSLADVMNEDVYSYQKVGGLGCFVRKPLNAEQVDWGGGPAEVWFTVIDRRFLIYATRRAILQEVVSGRGPHPDACLERLGWKTSDVDWNARMVVVRKYDPTSQLDMHSPVKTKLEDGYWPTTRGFPIERILLTYDPNQKTGRLVAVTKDPANALKYFRELCGDARAHATDEATSRTSGAAVDLVSSSGEVHTLSLNFKSERESEYGYDYGFGTIARIQMIYGYYQFR
jgi:hypothetical protein